MARTAIAVTSIKGPFIAPPGADSLDVALTAADIVNKNSAPYTGREVLVAYNGAGGSANVTISSAVDPFGASEDFENYAIAPGELMAFNLIGGLDRWQQSDGHVYFESANNAVKFGVLRIP